MALRERPGTSVAAGLVLGAALDAMLGDPRRGHPVAGFGALAARAERLLWADRRAPGAVLAGGAVAGAALAGLALQRAAGRRGPAATALATALATWTVLGGTSLAREAQAVGRALDAGDLAAARARLPALCGRDPAGLDAAGLARATVESVAENTCDAMVAPLLWGAAAGIPGLLAYRAVNTLDAMIGHHSPRYERFGWAAARLDDAANLLPARVSAVVAAAAAPAVGGRCRRALSTLRRDGHKHPSPNGGRVEAAFAGSLAIQLGGLNVYQGRAERRGVLGDGRTAAGPDIARAVRLSRLVSSVAVILAAIIAGAGHRKGRRD
jgi:adenosylcobinamide-phosphate synthase